MTVPDVVIVEDIGSVRVLRLNRPDKYNAMNRAMIETLSELLADAERDNTVRTVVLSGAGTTFSAGVDLKETAALASDDEIEAHAQRLAGLFLAVLDMPKPIIAAIEGYALGGGCGLAMSCDLAIAGDSAVFGYPEATKGVMPALVTPALVERVGRRKAFEILAMGRRHDAAAMRGMGLINAVVPSGGAFTEAVNWATELAERDPRIVAWIKSLCADCEVLSVEGGLARARELNASARRILKDTPGER